MCLRRGQGVDELGCKLRGARAVFGLGEMCVCAGQVVRLARVGLVPRRIILLSLVINTLDVGWCVIETGYYSIYWVIVL